MNNKRISSLVFIFVVVVFLGGCVASSYKNATKAFSKASTNVADSYIEVVGEFDDAHRRLAARKINGDTVRNYNQINSLLAYPERGDVLLRKNAMKGIKSYSEFLLKIASDESASGYAGKMKKFGETIESLGVAQAEVIGKALGAIGQLIIDYENGKKLSRLIVGSESYVQTVISHLSRDIENMARGLRGIKGDEWNILSDELKLQSGESSFIGSNESIDMILSLVEKEQRLNKIIAIIPKIKEGLSELSKNHTALADKASSRGKKALLANIQEFLKNTDVLVEAIESL